MSSHIFIGPPPLNFLPVPIDFAAHSPFPLKLYIGDKSLRLLAGSMRRLILSKTNGIEEGFRSKLTPYEVVSIQGPLHTLTATFLLVYPVQAMRNTWQWYNLHSRQHRWQ